MTVSLRDITAENVKAICRLRVRQEQERFVASNGQSIAEARFADHAWHRAIYHDEEPVGFVMVSIDPANSCPDPDASKDSDVPPTHWRTMLWRFMIDVKHQGLGYGREALQLVIAHIRRLPRVHTFYTSCISGEGGPEGFYLNMGFQSTGLVEEGEHILKLDLQPPFDSEDSDPVMISDPSTEEVAFLDKQLETYNKVQTGRDDFKPLNLIVRDTHGSVMAGLKAVTGWDWLYVQVLWVHKDHRRNRLGTQLLHRAEREARKRGCKGSCLSTFSFQSPNFYTRYGYSIFGYIEHYPAEHTMFFLKKAFSE